MMTPEKIKALREAAGLSIEDVGALFKYQGRGWEKKEFPESNSSYRKASLAEYYILKLLAAGKITTSDLR